MVRNATQALAWARGQHDDGGHEWQGRCLVFVRSCFDVGARYPSAANGWLNAQHRHFEVDGDRVPRGVPFWWTGGSHGYGHIVLSAGGGLCWSNDINVRGGISLVRINDITRRWGQRPGGWSEDINGVRIWRAPVLPVVDLSNVQAQFMYARTHGKSVKKVGGVARIAHALNRTYNLSVRTDGIVDKEVLDGYGTHEFHVPGKTKYGRVPDKATLPSLARGNFRIIA